jgi:hypothetical protein
MYDAVEKVLSERSIAQNRPKAPKNHSKTLQKRRLKALSRGQKTA